MATGSSNTEPREPSNPAPRKPVSTGKHLIIPHETLFLYPTADFKIYLEWTCVFSRHGTFESFTNILEARGTRTFPRASYN